MLPDVVLGYFTLQGLSKASVRPVGTAEILSLVPGVGDMKTESLDQGERVGWMAVVASCFKGIWKKRGKEKEQSKYKYINKYEFASFPQQRQSFLCWRPPGFPAYSSCVMHLV